MDQRKRDASPSQGIRDVIYTEHYARRIAAAVHEQIIDFSMNLTGQLMNAYPQGSPEYFVVVEAIRRAGLNVLKDAHPAESISADEHTLALVKCQAGPALRGVSPRTDLLPIITGPWARS